MADETVFDPARYVYVPIAELEHVLEAARVHLRFYDSVATLEECIRHGEPKIPTGIERWIEKYEREHRERMEQAS